MVMIVYDGTSGTVKELVRCADKDAPYQIKTLDKANKTYLQMNDPDVPWGQLRKPGSPNLNVVVNTATKTLEVING